MLTVLNDFLVEVLQEHHREEDIEDTPASGLMTLSFNSFLVILSPSTTKMRGHISHNEVLIMMDSGATHNFISPVMAQKLRLTATPTAHLNIVLGTSIMVQGSGVCREVSFVIQGWSFITDFIILELGQVDVILGVQWLSTLGDCRVN